MIPYANIDIENPNGFYDKYQLTDEEIDWLRLMAEDGMLQEAIDIFMSEYQLPPGTKYQDVVSRYIGESESGILSNKDGNNLTRNITLLTLGLSAVLTNNFSLFMKGAYAPVIFEVAGLKNADVRNSILKEVILDYEQRIEGAMSQTQVDVLNGIRTLQREMISENLLIKKSGIKGNMLDAEVDRFRSTLKSKYPELYGAMKNGNILISRKFGPEGESVRHYKVDYYTDMATRATLLNVDRNSNEIMARVNGERVVEYYLSDPRSVIKERELCQEVLHNLIEGVSVLALDEEASNILGCMTVEEAQNTPDYCMGIYCRHSIRRLPEDYLATINDKIKAAA